MGFPKNGSHTAFNFLIFPPSQIKIIHILLQNNIFVKLYMQNAADYNMVVLCSAIGTVEFWIWKIGEMGAWGLGGGQRINGKELILRASNIKP